MLSNTWDARRICRLLGYTEHILVIRMVREGIRKLLKSWQMRLASRDIQGITKKLQSYNYLFFLESLKVL